jgi:hypothetical protein
MSPMSLLLSSLAEIDTLEGSMTMESHFFMNCGQVGQIHVRKIACLNCENCRVQKYRQCRNVPFCGGLLSKNVKHKSGARDHAAETRYCSAIQDAGRALAVQVQAGTVIGSECVDEAEPYIVSLALTEEMTWEGVDGNSWMGAIVAGDC